MSYFRVKSCYLHKIEGGSSLKRVVWAVIISFISASLGIIWVMLQKRDQTSHDHSATLSSSSPPALESTNNLQLHSDPKRRKQNKTPMRIRKAIAVLLIVTSLGFFVPWLLNLAVNLSLFPPFGGFENAATFPPPKGFGYSPTRWWIIRSASAGSFQDRFFPHSIVEIHLLHPPVL